MPLPTGLQLGGGCDNEEPLQLWTYGRPTRNWPERHILQHLRQRLRRLLQRHRGKRGACSPLLSGLGGASVPQFQHEPLGGAECRLWRRVQVRQHMGHAASSSVGENREKWDAGEARLDNFF